MNGVCTIPQSILCLVGVEGVKPAAGSGKASLAAAPRNISRIEQSIQQKRCVERTQFKRGS